MTDTTTDEYLVAAPASREAQYQELFAAYDAARTDADDEEDTERAIDESILAVGKRRIFEVTISTGGPGEWLTCEVDEDGDLIRVQFECAWWSAVRTSTVNEGDALWRLADRMNPWNY